MIIFEAWGGEAFYSSDRNEWRSWLETNFETSEGVWFTFPMKDSG